MARKIFIIMALFVALLSDAAEEVRTWTGKTGATIEASFVKEEKGVVTLRRKDAVQVQVKLDALCDDDREYIKDLIYIAKEIKVIFKRTRGEFGLSLVKGSEDATIRDSVVVQVDLAPGEQKENLQNDSLWCIVSVDVLGKSITARDDKSAPTLKTDGVFVFVTYRVRNNMRHPVSVISPRLIDSEERAFSQAARSDAYNYIPEGTRLASVEHLQPGFTKLYCAFYEIPEGATPMAVEIYPCLAREYAMVGASGKRILLDSPAQDGGDESTGTTVTNSSGGKTTLFMNCVRTASSGSSSGSYLRDKTRSLSYAVDLRSTGKQPLNVKVTGYFIGETSDGREVILDTQEAEVALEPGRANRVTLTSKEISETRLRSWVLNDMRLSGAKLKGAVVQARTGSVISAGWASLPQWRKYADNPNLPKELGVAKLNEE